MESAVVAPPANPATPAVPAALADARSLAAPPVQSKTDHYHALRWGLIAVATFLRLWWLDGRPPHFDEGVNGWFTDQMRHLGAYQYDSSNYHGPLHFYVLYVFKALLGRNLWALRLPTALVGILTVDWCLRFEPFFGRRASLWTAVAMTVSPSMLYFHRDAIHETWLVFFLVLGCWGLCGLWQEGSRRHLWAVGLALAGMILTKETYLIHLGCLLIALVCVLLLELLQPSARRPLLLSETPPPLPPANPAGGVNRPRAWLMPQEPSWKPGACAPQRWSLNDLLAVAMVSLCLVGFFYSGNGYYPWGDQTFQEAVNYHEPGGTPKPGRPWMSKERRENLSQRSPLIGALLGWTWESKDPRNGLLGLVTAFHHWGNKSQDGEGHNKPFFYWTKLIARYEAWTVLGLLATLRYMVPMLPARWRRWRAVAVAVAAACAVAVAICEAKLGGPLHGWSEDTTRAFWYAVAGLIGAAGVAGVVWTPRSEGALRAWCVGGIALCLGALFLPLAQTDPSPLLISVSSPVAGAKSSPLLQADAFIYVVALAGAMAATVGMGLPAPADWRVRLIAIYGFGAVIAYSLIPYKTPWCIISMIWPFFFTGGAALAELAEATWLPGREVAMLLGAVAMTSDAEFAWDLNFRRPTDDKIGYVYVQSFNDVWTVVRPLLAEAKRDPTFYHDEGLIFCDSTYPLPWLLGDFEHISYYGSDSGRRDTLPANVDVNQADFLLVDDTRVPAVEAQLNDVYYKESIRLRPALEGLQLYLRASRFRWQMPQTREPEFHPTPPEEPTAQPPPPPPPGMEPGAMSPAGSGKPLPVTVEDDDEDDAKPPESPQK